jgi:hypothetical protein
VSDTDNKLVSRLNPTAKHKLSCLIHKNIKICSKGGGPHVGYVKSCSALAWKAFIFTPFPLHSLLYPVFSQSTSSETALNTSTSTSSQPSPLSLEGETLIFIPHISAHGCNKFLPLSLSHQSPRLKQFLSSTFLSKVH